MNPNRRGFQYVEGDKPVEERKSKWMRTVGGGGIQGTFGMRIYEEKREQWEECTEWGGEERVCVKEKTPWREVGMDHCLFTEKPEPQPNAKV